eukprot:CAMPEP_0174750388 /NCGR_PEP_ID=MMETSP1094-20130205/97630_1 /TAXON_ID=156173 /ORGANISM="Chrysochromulina brevifilum, Strain UTEX LB 985" /LENGTH=154 /DNA_ID=CAMNT_0015955739 /DNA_START=217 /DNA_END=678 /DNA_ORIENTATION=+
MSADSALRNMHLRTFHVYCTARARTHPSSFVPRPYACRAGAGAEHQHAILVGTLQTISAVGQTASLERCSRLGVGKKRAAGSHLRSLVHGLGGFLRDWPCCFGGLYAPPPRAVIIRGAALTCGMCFTQMVSEGWDIGRGEGEGEVLGEEKGRGR